MYHAEFINAKNCKGELYRDKNTGDLIIYCPHSYIIKPRFENRDESIANKFSYLVRTFNGFEGICIDCGDIILIHSEDVVDDKTFDKRIEERVKEMTQKSRKKR